MSGSDHAILDLGEEDLQFTNNDYKPQQAPSNSASLTQFPPMSPDGRDTDRLIGEAEGPGGGGSSNFWTLAYYQQFFDVDTTDVKARLLYSMLPVPGKSFLQHHIRPRPDLYGPFWICVTLVFSIAISGNVSDFLQKSVNLDSHAWHYDFHKVSLAATAVFSYASLLPAGLYGFLWWAGGAGASGAALTFLELVCLYGYSLSIYIPVSLLWLIQVSWWQWICVLAGAGLSGAVLFMPIWPAVRDGAAKSAWIVMGVVLALHLLLACGFMLYFFHVPPTAQDHPSTTIQTVTEVKAAEAAAQGGEHLKEGEEVKEKQEQKRSSSGPGAPVNNVLQEKDEGDSLNPAKSEEKGLENKMGEGVDEKVKDKGKVEQESKNIPNEKEPAHAA